MPARPKELANGLMMGDEGGGCLFVGSKGVLDVQHATGPALASSPTSSCWITSGRTKTIPRSPGIHEEWIAAIKAGKKSTTDFSEFAGPLTEVMLLGNVALRVQAARTVLEWDPIDMKFPNLPEADKFIQMDYRPGWAL